MLIHCLPISHLQHEFDINEMWRGKFYDDLDLEPYSYTYHISVNAVIEVESFDEISDQDNLKDFVPRGQDRKGGERDLQDIK